MDDSKKNKKQLLEELQTLRQKPSEQMINLAFITGLDAMCLTTIEEGIIIDVNEEFQNLLGYSREELIGKTSLSLNLYHNPLDREKAIAELKAKGRFKDWELTGRRKDGSLFLGLMSVSVIILNQKPYLFSLIKDITLKKQTEEALKISEEKFRAVFENNPTAISVIEPDRTFSMVNDTFCRIIGYSRKKLIGKPWTDLISPEDLPRLIEYNRRRLQNPEEAPRQYEVHYRHRNGELREAINLVSFIPSTRQLITSTIDITERKLAEKKLSASETRYRRLFSTVPAPIMVFRLEDGRFVDCNEAAAQLYGYTREEFFKLRHADITDEPQRSAKSIQKVAQGKLSKIPIRWHRKKDGTIFPVEISGGSFELEGQRLIFGVIKDITEQYESQKEKEKKYQTLIETTQTGYLIMDSEGKVIDANQEYVKLSGHKTLKEIIGRSVLEWTAVHDRARNKVEIANCLKRGFVRGLEIKYAVKGKKVPIEIHGTVMKTGQSKMILSLCRDISERKQIEEALLESENRYRTAIEQSNDGIMISKGVILFQVNKKLLEMFGYATPEEVVGQSIANFIAPQDRQRVLTYARKRNRNKTAPSKYEFQGLKKNGELIDLETSAAKIILRRENFIMSVIRDITARKKIEKSLQKDHDTLEERVKTRTRQLQYANEHLIREIKERKGIEKDLRESKDQLKRLSNQLINAQEIEKKRLAIELHDDLGQSLVGLKFHLSTIKNKSDAHSAKLKQEITHAIESVDLMTENVRRLSRDLRPAVLEHLGLLEALQWLWNDFSTRYQIKVIKKIKGSPFNFTKDQEIMIFRIFQEALTNIRKHTQANRVVIDLDQKNGSAVFSIKDNGKGFNLKAVKGKKSLDGGLGLTAITERAIMAGGTLELTSEVGQGTTIVFSIPLKQTKKKQSLYLLLPSVKVKG